MNNKISKSVVEINTSIEQLHSTWVQTMFQMVTVAFLATTFIRGDNVKYKKYRLVPHFIGFLIVITGIYSIYYTYKLDIDSYRDSEQRLLYSKIVTTIILLTLLFISAFVFFV